MKEIDPGRKTDRVLSFIFLGFTFLWGALAWFDLLFMTGPAARAMQGGVLFAPHLVLLLSGAAVFSLLPLFTVHIRWWWRLLVALVPASYVAFRLL